MRGNADKIMINPKKKLQIEAMNLWKNACILKYGGKCEVCNETYMVTPHHFYYRSSVPHLKFEVLNGVILCQYHHSKLHFRDAKLVEEEIIKVRGQKWLNKLISLAKNKPTSFLTIQWYNDNIKRLQKCLNQ